MGKKLKTSVQINALQSYLSKRSDNWPKHQLLSLAKRTGLTRSQVYKWLWDQRNLAKQQKKYEDNYQSTDYFTTNEKIKCQALSQKSFNSKKYRKIILKSEFQQIALSVPSKMQFCQKFVVPQETSPWAFYFLKKHGSLLTRTMMTQSNYSPEKIERVEEFRQVKEEYQKSRND